MSDGEYNFLENFIKNTDGDILEIGQGFSTILMLYATAGTSRKITSVDVQHKIKDYVQYLPLDYVSRLEFIQEDSKQIALHKEYNVVLIDAEHTYTAVKRDTRVVKEIANKSAFIVYDDYGTYPDIKKAVNDMIAADEIRFVKYIGEEEGWKYGNGGGAGYKRTLTDREGVICKIL